MSPRDAWNMTMREYNDLVAVDRMKPTEIIYDDETKDRMIGQHERRQILNG